MRVRDDLSLQIQAAYYGAYWNSGAKHKRTLKSVLKEIQGSRKRNRKKVPPLDIAEARRVFQRLKEKKDAQKCN